MKRPEEANAQFKGQLLAAKGWSEDNGAFHTKVTTQTTDLLTHSKHRKIHWPSVVVSFNCELDTI